MIGLFEGYLLKMAQQAKSQRLTDTQSLSIVANAFYLADDLLPRVSIHFVRQYRLRPPELDSFINKLGKLYEALRDTFCQRRAVAVLHDIWQWQTTSHLYTLNSIDKEGGVSPSVGVKRVMSYLGELKQTIRMCLNKEAVVQIISAILGELFKLLFHEASLWKDLSIGML